MKETFEYLYSFKYNNKDYIYLISKNHPFYFMEYNTSTNKLDYPDINTFKELYTKFYSNENIISFDMKSELKRIKEILSKRKFDVTPLVKTTSGLVSIALVLSMCGCTQTNEITPPSTTESTAIVETIDKNQEIKDYFSSYEMDVLPKEYDGNDYIFVNSFNNSSNKRQTTIHTFEEFRKITNLNFIPTWDDVIKAFQDNENIDTEKKTIILEAINNLRTKEELKEMDLSVLYINAKRMKFNYLTSQEIIISTNKDSAYAFFDSTSGIVTLPSDKPLEKFEFIHEVLGHGALAYREETEDSLIIFDCTNHIMLLNENRYTGYSLGIMVSEGGANMIAHLATDDYSVSIFYELFEEELRVIANLCNVSIGELFNHKGVSLYDLMYQNGINTPVEYIFKMDGICKGQLYCEFSYLMERLLVDATEEKLLNASEVQQEDIIKSTIAIIMDSYFNDKEELSFDYVGGTINYNFEDSASQYEANMNKLRGNK